MQKHKNLGLVSRWAGVGVGVGRSISLLDEEVSAIKHHHQQLEFFHWDFVFSILKNDNRTGYKDNNFLFPSC